MAVIIISSWLIRVEFIEIPQTLPASKTVRRYSETVGLICIERWVKAVKIQKQVGFHTFRHTYTTLLTQNNEEVKVVQELLRHANSRITLDRYAQAGMPSKRLAQSKLVRMVLNKGEALA